jgi:uncharacterized Ntn-hydrolase superfamily protein
MTRLPAMTRVLALFLFGASSLIDPSLSPAADREPASGGERPSRPVHTFSIVARDPATGELGVAVQSHWFSVGSVVPWAEAGVGAVATQSIIDPGYGPLGLDLMRAGKTAPEALKALLAADANADVRQVAMVDARGRSAAHTGDHCIQMAGQIVGKGYTTEANLMEKETVWGAMSRAYEQATGDLADRLLAALEAAQAEGGDIRGRQSAAILIVAGVSTGRPWIDRLVDLRVEDSDDPIGELKRLVRLNRAYHHMDAGDNLFAANDIAGAVREYGAAERLVPDNIEMIFWHAVTLVNAGRLDEALPLFGKVFADRVQGAKWAELVPRLPRSKMLPDDPKIIAKILAARH